jgi:hypothetical protein
MTEKHGQFDKQNKVLLDYNLKYKIDIYKSILIRINN